MKKQIWLYSLLLLLDLSSSHGYELIEEKVTVSPGCKGGVLYCKEEIHYNISPPEQVETNSEASIIHESNQKEEQLLFIKKPNAIQKEQSIDR